MPFGEVIKFSFWSICVKSLTINTDLNGFPLALDLDWGFWGSLTFKAKTLLKKVPISNKPSLTCRRQLLLNTSSKNRKSLGLPEKTKASFASRGNVCLYHFNQSWRGDDTLYETCTLVYSGGGKNEALTSFWQQCHNRPPAWDNQWIVPLKPKRLRKGTC